MRKRRRRDKDAIYMPRKADVNAALSSLAFLLSVFLAAEISLLPPPVVGDARKMTQQIRSSTAIVAVSLVVPFSLVPSIRYSIQLENPWYLDPRPPPSFPIPSTTPLPVRVLSCCTNDGIMKLVSSLTRYTLYSLYTFSVSHDVKGAARLRTSSLIIPRVVFFCRFSLEGTTTLGLKYSYSTNGDAV